MERELTAEVVSVPIATDELPPRVLPIATRCEGNRIQRDDAKRWLEKSREGSLTQG
jgi:hypothetical protein